MIMKDLFLSINHFKSEKDYSMEKVNLLLEDKLSKETRILGFSSAKQVEPTVINIAHAFLKLNINCSPNICE